MANGILSNGLLGMGGFGVGGQDMPTNSLLGNYYDPAEMRKYQIKQMLLGMGAGLMAEKGVGKGLALSLAAGDRAGTVYRDNAMDAYKIKNQQDEQEYQRSQDAKDEAYRQKLLAIQVAQEGRAADEAQYRTDQRDAADTAWGNFRNMPSTGVPVQNYGMADALWKMGKTEDAINAVQPQSSDAPEVKQFYDDNGNPYMAEWRNGRWVKVGGSKAASSGITIGPDGTVQIGGKALTEGQSKDTVFSTRAEGALPYVDAGEAAMTNIYQKGVGQIPVLGNYMTSDDYQVASSAGKEFLQALLRKDTGATIQPFEIQEYGSVYLPQPGDSKERLAYKKEARHRALAAMKAGMPPQAIIAQEKALQTPGASGGAATTSEGADAGWTTLPNGVKIRQKGN